MKRAKTMGRYLFGALFAVAGVNHFLNTAFYVAIMPPYLPWHQTLVYISGVAELILGILLLSRRYARQAAWGLIVLLIAVFPANIHMAMHPEQFPTLPALGLWFRLPLQAVLIGWAYCYTRDAAQPA